jgi:hypothetical protein
MKPAASTLPLQLGELALAVPQVMAHRLMRMALAGQVPSARDRKEFSRMSAEKSEAFAESWTAMALEASKLQQQLTRRYWQAWGWPLLTKPLPAAGAQAQLNQAVLDVLGKGLAPVHRRAVANAKRLRSTPLHRPQK